MFSPDPEKSDPPDPDSVPPPTEKLPLSVAILTDDSVTAQALLTACDALPSFDCRVRIGALRRDGHALTERPGEIVIFDTANAADHKLKATLFPTAPCIAIVHDVRVDVADLDAHPRAVTIVHFADLSATTLEMAVRSALRAHATLATARGAAAMEARRADHERQSRLRFIDDVAPIARALDGLIEIIVADAASDAGCDCSRLGLIDNWTKDLVATVARHQNAIAREQGDHADLCAIVEHVLPLFEARCAAQRQTLILSAPTEALFVSGFHQTLREAVQRLLASILEREGADRRIDVLLWRSLDEVRLAFVTGPSTRRTDGDDAHAGEVSTRSLHEAARVDAGFADALAMLRALDANVDVTSSAAGATVLIALRASR